MIAVRITLESGHSWTTKINATLEQAKTYFLGKMWPLGSYEEENWEEAVKVEEVKA